MVNKKDIKQELREDFKRGIGVNNNFILIPFTKEFPKKNLKIILNNTDFCGFIFTSKELRKIFKTLNKIGGNN